MVSSYGTKKVKELINALKYQEKNWRDVSNQQNQFPVERGFVSTVMQKKLRLIYFHESGYSKCSSKNLTYSPVTFHAITFLQQNLWSNVIGCTNSRISLQSHDQSQTK